MCPDSTFSFEEAHDISDAFSGWDGEDKMNMVGHRMAFENDDMPLFCKFADDLANALAGVSVEFFLSVLWYNDHVVFTVPYHMTL